MTKVPPILSLQIWDADIFQPDEFIGSIEIELNNMILPSRTSDRAKPKKEGAKSSGISLFTKKHVSGWYACTNPEDPGKCTVCRFSLSPLLRFLTLINTCFYSILG